MEIITETKFMAVLDLENISVMKITLLWPFPILLAAVQKVKELNSLLVRITEPQLSFV